MKMDEILNIIKNKKYKNIKIDKLYNKIIIEGRYLPLFTIKINKRNAIILTARKTYCTCNPIIINFIKQYI